MQAVKPHPSAHFRNGPYDVDLKMFNERKLAISVVDSLERVEYHQPECVLQNIGVNTLMKALEQSKMEIKASFSRNKVEENQLLQIKVVVQSQFLKPVTEVILLKKLRQVSEEETVKRALDFLSSKIKKLRESNDNHKLNTYCGAKTQQKSYSGNNYESMAKIKLPKGKYALTFNFLLKASSSWLYIYLNEGGNLMPNSGFYVPNNTNFTAHTIRTVHVVNQESQNVSFNTYYAGSYPVTIKNAIITARPLPE